MGDKLIISAAVCGSVPTKEQNPNVPYTPAAIADEALGAWRAGAAIAHIHVRNPQTGAPDSRIEFFAEVVERIRSASDLLINLTTSGFNITGPDAAERRLAPISLKPELCSLDVGSLNFRQGVFLNPTDWVERAAEKMRAADVKPEIEVFDLGHLRSNRARPNRRPTVDTAVFGGPLGYRGHATSTTRHAPTPARQCALVGFGTGFTTTATNHTRPADGRARARRL